MGTCFWTRRFVVVFLGALVVIGAGQLLQGRTLDHALSHGGLWAFVAATVFTAVRLYQARRGRHCAICRDTAEMQD